MSPIKATRCRRPGAQCVSNLLPTITNQPADRESQELVEECPAAKALFDKASDILGYDLLKVRGGRSG
jgi:hypothetical protein